MVICTRKLRKAKSTHMKYPCIPVWMKEREKDPFDYPLRSRKEICFEQYMNPPLFNMEIIFNNYASIQDAHVNTHRADKRNDEIILELNINDMRLTQLQKKRLIFLLGDRWKNNAKVKIVSKLYTNKKDNLTKALDILRQLYWEAKRAPMYLWSKMRNNQRRRVQNSIFGKQTPENLKRLKIERTIENEKKKIYFDNVFDNGEYTPEFVINNAQQILDKKAKKGEKTETEKLEHEKSLESKKKMEEILMKENLQQNMVKKNILSKKAYETFFKNDIE